MERYTDDAGPSQAASGRTLTRRELLAIQTGAATAALAACRPLTREGPSATAPRVGRVVEIVTHDWEQDPGDQFYGPFWKRFEERHPNIRIKREWFPRGEMHTKILVLAAANQVGDTIRINVAPLTAELKIKGVIQPLDPFIKKDKAWADNDHKQFWPGNIATYTIQGQQWGYPIVGHPGCIHYYYNIDHLSRHGAKLPPADLDRLTFDMRRWRLEDALETFTGAMVRGTDGQVVTYGVQPCLGGEGTVAVLRAFGGNYYSDDGTRCLINTPESIAGISWLADLWHKYRVAIPVELNPNYQQTFPGGQVAVVVLTAVAGTIKNLVKDSFRWSIAPPPIGPSGKPETQVSSDGIGMSRTTKYPEETWEVIKAYVSKEHGLERHFAGLGSPGSRYDVWTDERFKREQPLLATIIYDTLINPRTAPPLRPWSYPANGRYFETDAAMNTILRDVWIGKKSPKEAAEEAFRTVQTIMDQPPA